MENVMKSTHFERGDTYLPYHFNRAKQNKKIVLLGQLIKVVFGLPSVLYGINCKLSWVQSGLLYNSCAHLPHFDDDFWRT